MEKKTGGCLCGSVRYEINGRPKLAVSCYCRDCQYVSGGAPAHALIIRAEDVTITKGRAKEYWTTSAKGNRVARMFCQTCGTPLLAKNEKHPEFLAIKVGSLDDPSQFRARANIWVKSSQSWHRVGGTIPRFKSDPDFGLTAFIELARTSIVKLCQAARYCRKSGPHR